MNTLSLNIVYTGSTHVNPISRVRISLDQLASLDALDLRDTILSNPPPQLKDVDAHDVVLYRAPEISCEPSRSVVERIRLFRRSSTLQPLEIGTKLDVIFPGQPPTDQVHILLDVYPPTIPLGTLSIADLRTDFLAAYPARVPSSGGDPSVFNSLQNDSKKTIPCGRPASAFATIPVTLLDPILGTFSEDYRLSNPSPEDNHLARDLCLKLSAKFVNEDQRNASILELFAEHGIYVRGGNIYHPKGKASYRTDGELVTTLFRYMILEIKNEIGQGGAEPFYESILYYLESFRELRGKLKDTETRSNFPCLVMVHFGAHICFGGALFLDRPHFQVLTPSLPLFFHPSDSAAQLDLARSIRAMKNALVSLQSYYETEFAKGPSPQPSFPHRNFYMPLSTEQHRVHFTYESQPYQDKLVFFCKTVAGTSICVKYVTRYSAEVHTLCADAGFAPQLLGFDSLPGSWFMVVMERVSDEYSRFVPCDDLLPIITDRITSEVHQKGFVHGDIRRSNLMLHDKEPSQFMLLDFDWAGKIEDTRYPPNINRGPGLWRPSRVQDGQYILADDDLAMINALFEL